MQKASQTRSPRSPDPAAPPDPTVGALAGAAPCPRRDRCGRSDAGGVLLHRRGPRAAHGAVLLPDGDRDLPGPQRALRRQLGLRPPVQRGDGPGGRPADGARHRQADPRRPERGPDPGRCSAPTSCCRSARTLLAFEPCYGQLLVNTNTYLSPGACSPIPYSTPFITAYATIGAFASGAVLAENPMGAGVRLFVPVRGDPSITWFDVTDDRVPGSAGAPQRPRLRADGRPQPVRRRAPDGRRPLRQLP